MCLYCRGFAGPPVVAACSLTTTGVLGRTEPDISSSDFPKLHDLTFAYRTAGTYLAFYRFVPCPPLLLSLSKMLMHH